MNYFFHYKPVTLISKYPFFLPNQLGITKIISTFPNNMTNAPDPQSLQKLVTMKMPFGKYKGVILCDLPVHYLEWFAREGYPQGNLGMLLSTLHIIKTNGLTYLLEPLKKNTK
jgi:uncharacterized protein